MKHPAIQKLSSLLAVVLILTLFSAFAMGSSDSDDGGTDDQGSDSASVEQSKNNLGDYKVDITSCRLAADYEGKPIVIVKYTFTNNGENAVAFWIALDETVYQGGVGLNECYFAAEGANYSSDNQSKEIKQGATIEVEVAYELNDTTTDIEVEVSELFSFSNKKVTKIFKIQ